MSEKSSSLKKPLPRSYYLRTADNIDTLRQCIRDARLAARNPDASPAARHLHRIVASAALQFLRHIKNCQAVHARRADRLVNDAVRELETLQLEAAL
jgi:hypothetical protein